jgi:hypothetical protein
MEMRGIQKKKENTLIVPSFEPAIIYLAPGANEIATQ